MAQLPCYPTAVVNTWHAGQCTAVMMVSLASLGIDPRTMHVLGFSLGAHVASYAGNWIFSTMGIKVGRITGICSKQSKQIPTNSVNNSTMVLCSSSTVEINETDQS